MKKIIPFFLVCIACLENSFAQEARQEILFNNDWKFNKGDVESADKPGYNDAAWKKLNLPHDWSIEGLFSKEWASATAYLPAGIGWYRKNFTAAKEWKGKNVFIYFDGVYKNSEVWINGHYLGKRPNGFSSFEYELTPYLNFSGNNVIAVKADHTQFADSRWYNGSGIYRNVYLKVLNPVHIGLWGVSFVTPRVSQEQATADITVSIEHTTPGPLPVFVKTILKDENGKQVAAAEKKLDITKDGAVTGTLSLMIDHPQLWSPDRPYLYTLSTLVRVENKITDETSEQVGIRSFHFDPNEGFFLNGVNMKQKGVCLHDDAGVLGVAVPEEVWIRRLRALKAAGCNAIRMSHNPHADYLYRLCDKLGMLVQDEAFDEWEFGKNKWISGWNKGVPGKDGYHEYFSQWAETDVRDMILRNRNRPSIIMWSIGNEIDYPNDPYSDKILDEGKSPQIYGRGYVADHPAAERLGILSKQLAETVRKYDTTRPVTAALAGVVMSNTTSYPDNIDLVGYNYQEYRYAGDHAKYPARIIYGSENGMQLNAWNAVDSNQYISGQYLWTGIDYMGEAGVFPVRSSSAGLLDLGGFTKPEYYFRQSLWSQNPMVYIGTSPIKSEDRSMGGHRRMVPVWKGADGDSIRVSCFSNCTEAELFLNGQSLGKKKMSDSRNRMLTWDMVYKPGELVAVGYKEGSEAARTKLLSTGTAARIATAEYKDVLIPEQGGVKQIEVTITDDKDRFVYGADNEISVSVSGDAKLMGLESGNPSDITSYTTNKCKVLNGRLLLYVRAGKGAFQVSLTSQGLATKLLKF